MLKLIRTTSSSIKMLVLEMSVMLPLASAACQETVIDFTQLVSYVCIVPLYN